MLYLCLSSCQDHATTLNINPSKNTNQHWLQQNYGKQIGAQESNMTLLIRLISALKSFRGQEESQKNKKRAVLTWRDGMWMWMLVWHWAWMWNTCSGWMELGPFSILGNSSSPTTTLLRLTDSLTVQNGNFSSSFLLFSSKFFGEGGLVRGVAGLKLRGLWGQYEAVQAAREQPLGGREAKQPLVVPRLIFPRGHRPSVLAHSPQRFHQKRNQLGTRPLPLTQNAGIFCLSLQILGARSKF